MNRLMDGRTDGRMDGRMDEGPAGLPEGRHETDTQRQGANNTMTSIKCLECHCRQSSPSSPSRNSPSRPATHALRHLFCDRPSDQGSATTPTTTLPPRASGSTTTPKDSSATTPNSKLHHDCADYSILSGVLLLLGGLGPSLKTLSCRSVGGTLATFLFRVGVGDLLTTRPRRIG